MRARCAPLRCDSAGWEVKMNVTALIRVWLRRGLAPALSLALLAMAGRAEASCSPPAPINDANVTCTGATLNANGTAGYGTVNDRDNTYEIVQGASVTGDNSGLLLSFGTVENSGTILGNGFFGIDAASVTLTNRGTIRAMDLGGVGVSADAVTITNTGTIEAPAYGVRGANSANVTNVAGGVIRATGVDGVAVNSPKLVVVNSGTITGTVDSVLADAKATGTNAGVIGGGTYGIRVGLLANVVNSGIISGTNIGISAPTINLINTGGISAGNGVGIGATALNLDNSGTVAGIQAISVAAATVNNSGTITGLTQGINANQANVQNTGLIQATAGNGTAVVGTSGILEVYNAGTIVSNLGIFSAGAATIMNSGTVTGTGGTAIRLSNASDTLTLLPGSKIKGTRAAPLPREGVFASRSKPASAPAA